jgi:hypothetical protein
VGEGGLANERFCRLELEDPEGLGDAASTIHAATLGWVRPHAHVTIPSVILNVDAPSVWCARAHHVWEKYSQFGFCIHSPTSYLTRLVSDRRTFLHPTKHRYIMDLFQLRSLSGMIPAMNVMHSQWHLQFPSFLHSHIAHLLAASCGRSWFARRIYRCVGKSAPLVRSKKGPPTCFSTHTPRTTVAMGVG